MLQYVTATISLRPKNRPLGAAAGTDEGIGLRCSLTLGVEVFYMSLLRVSCPDVWSLVQTSMVEYSILYRVPYVVEPNPPEQRGTHIYTTVRMFGYRQQRSGVQNFYRSPALWQSTTPAVYVELSIAHRRLSVGLLTRGPNRTVRPTCLPTHRSIDRLTSVYICRREILASETVTPWKARSAAWTSVPSRTTTSTLTTCR